MPGISLAADQAVSGSTGRTAGTGGLAAALILGGAFGLVVLDRNALNFLVPYLRKAIPLDHTEFGRIAAIRAIAWASSGLTLTQIADRTGRRKALLLGTVLLFSTASAITGRARGFTELFGARRLVALASRFGWRFTCYLSALPPAIALGMGAGELFGGAAGFLADRFGNAAPLLTQTALALTAAAIGLALRATAPARKPALISGIRP